MSELDKTYSNKYQIEDIENHKLCWRCEEFYFIFSCHGKMIRDYICIVLGSGKTNEFP